MNRSSLFHSILLSSACLLAINSGHAQENEPVDTVEQPEEEARTLQTVQVRGRFIPQEVRTTSEVANFIDSADFSLQGDADAASALARVAGLSTSQDNFIYVRGLNERYSTALLNGSPLPSPAPLRRGRRLGRTTRPAEKFWRNWWRLRLRETGRSRCAANRA